MYLINLTCQIECSNVWRCHTPDPKNNNDAIYSLILTWPFNPHTISKDLKLKSLSGKPDQIMLLIICMYWKKWGQANYLKDSECSLFITNGMKNNTKKDIVLKV